MAGRDVVYTAAPANDTVTKLALDADSNHNVIVYVLLPVGSVLLVAIVIMGIVFMLKRSRLERLRHHLMPMYNFEPADSGGDWEADLLEEERRQQQVRLRVDDSSPPDSPLLKMPSGYSSLQ